MKEAGLPRYMRRIPSIDNLIPILYLKVYPQLILLKALSAILGGMQRGYQPIP
jgi:hypothetical protein